MIRHRTILEDTMTEFRVQCEVLSSADMAAGMTSRARRPEMETLAG
jgi:hypothetical protein